MLWHDHIYYISSKISKSLNRIAKLKQHLTVQSLLCVYCALVHPYLTWGCILWGNNYEVLLSQLVKLQNKAIRIINNVPIRDHVTPHYVSLGLIKLPDVIKLSTCQLFYGYIVDKKSSNFALSFVSEIHDYAIRSISSQHLNPSPFRINKFFPTVIGCYYSNDIPMSICFIFYLNICCLRCDSYSLSYILYLTFVSYILHLIVSLLFTVWKNVI